MPQKRRLAKLFAITALLASGARAHEFWIEPRDYTVDVGGVIEGDLKNGQYFKGSTYPYIPRLFSQFVLVDRSGQSPVEGRTGDTPALSVEAQRGGLHVFAYASTTNVVNYATFEKFENFVKEKKLLNIAEDHKARGYPMEKFKETYYRYAKALVKVGSGAGRDKPIGMPIELVAEINPYSAAAKDGVRFQLLWRGAPLPDWDIQVFHFAPGAEDAELTHYRTDKTGRVVVPAGPGGEFLVNAVQIIDPRPEDKGHKAVWESLWASTTYELPAAQ